MLYHKVGFEGVRVIVIEHRPLFKALIRMRFIVVIMVNNADFVPEALTELIDKRCFAASRTAGYTNYHYIFHFPDIPFMIYSESSINQRQPKDNNLKEIAGLERSLS
jgi:hypothetical protein